ncbi:hypothetical protein CEN44_18145 [Fischerella muscicola CCMEE 5323]|uniref:Uncharacterized protein n=2 Tax=Hapalosiphonaceae TaxID=1892263 RepID=A0A2N6K007_FISMU|nr:hypothetical protein [Fischerella sp. FACHB-380]PLZ87173.1 hypothetical protein CEN44_18145 [Fischerella muscicola CCMEE 5323]
MELQETQTQKTGNNLPVVENIPNYKNSEQIKESGSITQVKTENVTINKDLPDPRLIIGFTLIVASLLFVAAIYYGIINP